jgi:hypothetical protein
MKINDLMTVVSEAHAHCDDCGDDSDANPIVFNVRTTSGAVWRRYDVVRVPGTDAVELQKDDAAPVWIAAAAVESVQVAGGGDDA